MSSESDEELSAKDFDPLKLLYSNDVESKPGQYCLFDNLASLEGYFKRTGENLEIKFDKKNRPAPVTKAAPIHKGETVARRFLPHQEMIHVPRRIKKRHMRSVLTDMSTMTGPMAQLNVWLTSRTRVKVLIRKNHGIRGFVIGTLQIFDKHWNLTMTDVEEQYQRRKLRCGKELVLPAVDEELALQRLRELGLEDKVAKPPSVKIVDKKRVEIRKKHDLLFIKGDQVAVVMEYLNTSGQGGDSSQLRT